MSELHGLWQWIVGAQPRSAPTRQLVVVAGGSARVGTTVATALLARAAAASGRSVLLVDGQGALAPLFGTTTLSDAQGNPVLTAVDDGLTLVSATMPPALPDSQRAAMRARLRRVAALVPQFDVVFVDAGSRLAAIRDLWSALADARSATDRMLVVTTPDAAAAATYALVKVLTTRMTATRVDLLVSRSDADGSAAVFARLESAAHRFLRRRVGFVGALPDEPRLRSGSTRGALRDVPPHTLHSDAAAEELLQRMLCLVHATLPAPAGRHPHSGIHQ